MNVHVDTCDHLMTEVGRAINIQKGERQRDRGRWGEKLAAQILSVSQFLVPAQLFFCVSFSVIAW